MLHCFVTVVAPQTPPPVHTNFSDSDFIMIRDSPNKNKGNRAK